MSSFSRRHRQAFTLMEIALVLAILVAVAAMAGPAYLGTLKRERVRKAAEGIGADWTRTRALAIETGTTQLWVCTVATGDYSASAYVADNSLTNGDVAGMVGQTGSTTPVTPNTSDPDATFGQTMPEGVSISEVLVTDGDTRITMDMTTSAGEGGTATLLFYPDGSSSSARITVTGEDNAAMAAVINGAAGTVRVMPVETPQ